MAAGLSLNAGALVRVLDATGKVVAEKKAVTAATGAYGPITLTGAGPYRVEACGSVGDRPICLWGATNNGGTLHLTPLTSAIAVLASGQPPETLMNGAAQGLSDAALASAQTQLRTALAPALADAGLASDFDLLAGALTPGAHTGHDRVLDTVAVGLGSDTKAFVTLTSRLGGGTAYLEAGAATQGSLTFDAGAAGVDLTGLHALVTRLATATANVVNCQSAVNGLVTVFDTNGRAGVDVLSAPFVGAQQAASLACLRLDGSFGDDKLFGSSLLPTQLGRCDFGAGDPVCRIDWIYQTPAGLQRRFGIEQAAVKRPAGWTLLGNRLEVQASANARLVLARRVDSTAPDVTARYLDISIPAITATGGGVLRCARVSQKDTSGADVPLALFKKAAGSYLSLWSVSSSDATPSLDPASGATRGNNIVTVPVPAGAAGDAVARNFVRAGRSLKIELFQDAGCATPLGGLDGDAIGIELAGQLPVTAAAQSGQPWPALVAKAVTDLTGMKGAVNAKINYGPTWTLPRGDLLPDRALLCTDAACNAKLAELELGVSSKGVFATGASLAATVGNTALNTTSYKLLRILGRMPDGLVLQLDSQSCSAQIASLPC